MRKIVGMNSGVTLKSQSPVYVVSQIGNVYVRFYHLHVFSFAIRCAKFH